jgi:hypothetical protein
MTGLKSAFAAIHRVNADPEKKFAAAMVASAAESARDGDCTAYVWIERCSLRWLHAITPDGDDCERVLKELLARIPALECDAASQSSETSGYAVQLQIPGLEVHHGYRNT